MSNQAGNVQNDAPLFQTMDEQEQVYAPQQVPGAVLPGEELDRGGTAGTTAAGVARGAGTSRHQRNNADHYTGHQLPRRERGRRKRTHPKLRVVEDGANIVHIVGTVGILNRPLC